MIGFDTHQGFLLLLLFPFLWLYRFRVTRIKPVSLSFLPVIETALRRYGRRPPRLFRLSRKLRIILNGAALLLLVLAFNGTHVVTGGRSDGEWLVVFDNPYTQNATYQARTLQDRSREGLGNLLEKIPSRDSITLMTSAPEPELFPHVSRRDLRRMITRVRPSATAPSVASLLEVIEEIVRDRPLKGIIPISPRDHEWRTAAAAEDMIDIIHFSPVKDILTGNAGITSFDLSPSPGSEGKFDLFFRIGSAGIPVQRLTASLITSTADPISFSIDLDDRGLARYHERDLDLTEGPVTLRLEIEDTLPDDNSVSAFVQEQRTISVGLRGEIHPFILDAVRSHDGFRIIDGPSSSTRPSVDIYLGSSPEGSLERPSLVIRPTEDFLGFRFDRYRERPAGAVFQRTHPATRNVRFQNFRPSRVIGFLSPPDYRVLARSGDVPLIIAGRHSRKRMMVWTFDPLGGGIFLDPSFIILLRDSLEWLSGTTPVVWGSKAECGEYLPSATDDGHGEPWTQNLLCAGITGEAGYITVPDLSLMHLPDGGADRPERVDLASWLLLAAILTLVYLSLAEAYDSGAVP
ncbi:MAG: hypothetical protein JSV26_09690 [bacterium]|nr:MAG: hypothetical protein JSV26_09690 [bacterium]